MVESQEVINVCSRIAINSDTDGVGKRWRLLYLLMQPVLTVVSHLIALKGRLVNH